MTPPINNDPWNYHGIAGGSYTPNHNCKDNWKMPTIFSSRTTLKVTINGGVTQSGGSGNFWSGLWNGLTGYNNYGMKTGFGIFDLGFAFLANKLFGGNRPGGAYNINSFWSNPGLGTGMDTFRLANSYVIPGQNIPTTPKAEGKKTPENTKKDVDDNNDDGKAKDAKAKDAPSDDRGVGKKPVTAQTLNDAIAGKTPGITHNTQRENSKPTADVAGKKGEDNVHAGLPEGKKYPKGDTADTKDKGFQKYFYETDASGNTYAYVFSNYDEASHRVQYKFYKEGSTISNGWKLNEKYDIDRKLEVMVADGLVKVINDDSEPIAIPNK